MEKAAANLPLTDYDGFVAQAWKLFEVLTTRAMASEDDVAQVIYTAMTDETNQLRYVATKDVEPHSSITLCAYCFVWRRSIAENRSSVLDGFHAGTLKFRAYSYSLPLFDWRGRDEVAHNNRRCHPGFGDRQCRQL
jgi:hypothetical protein